jgi:hypothetical protein
MALQACAIFLKSIKTLKGVTPLFASQAATPKIEMNPSFLLGKKIKRRAALAGMTRYLCGQAGTLAGKGQS